MRYGTGTQSADHRWTSGGVTSPNRFMLAAVVSAEDLQTLEALEDRLDLEEAPRIMKKPGRLIPWEKVKSELGL